MEMKHDEAARQFVLLDDDGTRMGEIEYKKGGNNDLYATHTEVFAPFEGQGHAGRLLDALVNFAEQNNAKIVPICPYVIAAFKKYPEKYAAVINPKK
ncbi:N-acetyltransferase [Ruminococcaceae bacterium OttesenSCG-928-A16]|nr:N-acetyltransferase [Ruminococcaceae bacterium OttesenSCG-928-A16]